MMDNTKQTFTAEIKKFLSGIKEKKCCRKANEFAKVFLEEDIVLDRALFKCDECKNAFLRGVFIRCASVNAPDKSNHLEFKLSNEPDADELTILLRECGFEAKVSKRRNTYIVYFKDGETIFQLLSVMGAQKYAFDFLNTIIEKQIRNDVNRVQNCELANMQKTASAALKVMEAINTLEKDGSFDSLQEKLHYTASLRRDNPDLSLSELAQIHEPPITKSCVNHRLEKIVKIAFGE